MTKIPVSAVALAWLLGLMSAQAAEPGATDVSPELARGDVPLTEQAKETATVDIEAPRAASAYFGMMNRDGDTPLHVAAQIGFDLTVQALLAAGAEVNTRFMAPIHEAALEGRVSVIRLLLDFGAEVDSNASPDGFSPLHWAAASGHVEAVHALLQGGAEVDSKDLDGETPLLHAARHGHGAVVEVLTAAGGTAAGWRRQRHADSRLK